MNETKGRRARLWAIAGVAIGVGIAAYWLGFSSPHRPVAYRLLYAAALLTIAANGLIGVRVIERRTRLARNQFIFSAALGVIVPLGLLAAPAFIVAAVFTHQLLRAAEAN